MTVFLVVSQTAIFLMMGSQTMSQLQPMNITRTAGEGFVIIPCPFETSSTRSIWRINGIDYTAATLPSAYSLTPGGLVIITVDICLDQVSFQCIDISSNSLQAEMSQVGVLTVMSLTDENCTDEKLREYLGFGTAATGFELDHRRMQYGSINTTLAWKITPAGSECNMSRILSYRPCQQNNPDINVTIDNTRITVPSTSLYISGQLADFSLSGLKEQDAVYCAGLVENDTVRINVSETETVNVLLGNNNCSSVRLESLQELYFAVSNPEPNELDIICPIHIRHGKLCFSPEMCNNFNNSDITSFFRICGTAESSFTLYSSNVTEQLIPSLRLDFFTLTKVSCTPLYYSRTYIRSFEFKAANASSNVEVNITSRQICFSSLTDCSLANLTQYSVVINDLSGNIIVKRDKIPESTCLTVDLLGLLPQCGPFTIITRPVNDYIMYNSDHQHISSGADTEEEPELGSCLEASVQLQLDAVYDSQDSSVEVNLWCSTIYVTPIYITLIDRDGFVNQTKYTCSNKRFIIMADNGCNQDIHLCGYFTFENGSVVLENPLNCSNLVQVPCPTTPPTPLPFPIGAIIGIVLGVLVLVVILIAIIIIIVIIRRPKSEQERNAPNFGLPGGNGGDRDGGATPASNDSGPTVAQDRSDTNEEVEQIDQL